MIGGRFKSIDIGRPVNWLAPLNRGLVGWYFVTPFMLGSARMLDLTAAYSGTLTAGAAWGIGGRLGAFGSVAIDPGHSDGGQRVVTPASNVLSDPPYSIVLWAKIATGRLANSASATMLDVGNAGVVRLSLRDTFGSLRFTADFATTDMIVVAATAMDVEDKWYQVGMTWNGGTTAASDVKLYLDGVDAGHSAGLSVNGSGSVVSYANSVKVIGNGNFNINEWKGSIDDVRLYNRVLGADEVAGLFQASRTGYKRELNWVRSAAVASVATGNRRRRVLIGAAA